MEPLAAGSTAPAIPGVDFSDGPRVLFFYKVTCPVCQMAAPKVQRIQEASPGAIEGIGEDAAEDLDAFGARFGLTFPSVPDVPPYDLSNAYGLRVVPTTFLVGTDGLILRTVESWDRDALNDLSTALAGLTGSTSALVSEPGDGLPAFRPG
jgi:peroxiredoxin